MSHTSPKWLDNTLQGIISEYEHLALAQVGVTYTDTPEYTV